MTRNTTPSGTVHVLHYESEMQNWEEELPLCTAFTSLLKQIKLKMSPIFSKTNYTSVSPFEI